MLDELRVEQHGCPAILLNMQLLAKHFNAAGAALAEPGLRFAFLHLGDLSGLEAMVRCDGVLGHRLASSRLDPRESLGTIHAIDKPAVGRSASLGQFGFEEFTANGVEIARDKDGLRVSMPRSAWQDPAREALADRDCMAVVPADFQNGVIEVDVMGELAPGAPDFARGFVGVAFRIGGGKFEQFYLRPTNGIADDQVRRNHSVQYAAYPDYRFGRLRRESPERYETAADIAPGRWTHMRIEVSGAEARLHLDRRPNPHLIVKDLKLGTDQRGGIGLWVETATIAHFRNLRVTHAKP